MTDVMVRPQQSDAKRRAKLKGLFFEMSRAAELDRLLNSTVNDFDASLLCGEHQECNGLVVVGESNSGKTREINRALLRLSQRQPVLESGRPVRYLQIALDGETTWKSLGLHVVSELGYQMTGRRTEHEIWTQVRRQLERTGTWLIHIDECQHMFETLGEKETRKVINSIKTFMKHRHWPVVIVLSGIPELLEKVNFDPQFRNLMTPFHMGAINPLSENDLDEIDTAFVGYAQVAGVDIEEVRTKDVYLRLCHAHGNLYGRVFKFMVDVFSSIPPDRDHLTLDFLAERYAERMGCMPGHNPFVRDDYEACDVDILLAGVV